MQIPPLTTTTTTTSTTSNINTKYTMIQTLQSQIEEAWQQTTVDHIKTLLPPGREIIILSKEINKSGFLPITFAVWKGATVNVVYYLYSLNKQKVYPGKVIMQIGIYYIMLHISNVIIYFHY